MSTAAFLDGDEILGALPDALIVTDAEGRVQIWNQKAEGLYGWTADEAVGQPIYDLTTGPESTDEAAEIMSALGSGQEWAGDFLVQRRDGTSFLAFVRNAPVLDEYGKITGVVGLSRDVTNARVRDRISHEVAYLQAGHNLGQEMFAGVLYLRRDGSARWLRIEQDTGIASERLAPGGRPAFHTEDFGRSEREALGRAMADGRTIDRLVRIQQADDGLRWCRFRFSPVQDAQGRRSLIVVTGVDVHERAGQEQILAQRERIFRELADSIPVLIIVSFPDEQSGSRPAYYNRYFFEYTGLTEQDLLDEATRQSLYTAEDRTRMPQYRARAGQPEPFEGGFRFRRADGEYRWHRVVHRPIVDEAGTVVLFVTVAVDVHETHLAEEATAELAAIVDSSGDAIIGRTLEGTITSWNRGAERMFGFTADEMVDQRIDAIVPADLQHEVDEIAQRLLAGEGPITFESERVTKDGARKPVSITMSPVLDRSGRITRISAVVRDISAHLRLVAQLEQANAAKDELMGLVSHELRNPITSIVGFSHVLERRRGQYDEATAEIHDDVMHEAVRLRALIENMLSLAHPGEVASLEPVLLQRVIPDAIRGLRPVAGDLRVELSIPEDLPAVEGRTMWIEQIIQNLLTNAAKYGGDAPVEIVAAERDEGVVLEVCDRGPGIPVEEIERLFEPFYRAKSASAQPGVGLGLAVCMRLCSLQGGYLRARPRDGGGMVFETGLRRAPDSA